MTIRSCTNRRELLTGASRAIIGATLGHRVTGAYRLPITSSDTKFAPNDYCPPGDSSYLEALATAAVTTARSAGASYADVRVAERHTIRVGRNVRNALVPDIWLQVTFAYGIHALVDGQWAFAHGTIPEVDAITMATRAVVSSARGYAKAFASRSTGDATLSAMQPVTGVWSSPVHIDPFTVPLEEQLALLWACDTAASRSVGGMLNPFSNFAWTRETRVFGSTDGSLVTQSTYRSFPELGVRAGRGMGNVELGLRGIAASTGGYETVLRPDLQDQMAVAAEEAVRFARLPQRPMDVGRYPVVTDGYTLGVLFGSTIGPALELDRVLGDDIDASGASFLSPVSDVLGASLFAPLLSVTANRALPSSDAVQWDDEGVAPEPYTVITGGRVVDFHTSRRSLSVFEAQQQHSDHKLRAHGCAVAPDVQNPVTVCTPHLSVSPSKNDLTIDTLCKEIQHGLLIRQGRWVSSDQRFASGMLDDGLMLEIERGQIVRRIHGSGLEFSTRDLWKSLAALGGTTSIETSAVQSHKGQPWIAATHSVTAPAGLFPNVNVIMTERQR